MHGGSYYTGHVVRKKIALAESRSRVGVSFLLLLRLEKEETSADLAKTLEV